jgi:hypothetical protein
MTFDINQFDYMRTKAGFLTISEVIERFGKMNILLDPFSILITENVQLGEGNILYPGIRIFCANGYRMILGDKNTLFSGTVFEASAGDIAVGNSNEIGERGFSAYANRAGAEITIGSNGRYQGNASVFGKTSLGSGTQILGQITVNNCILEAGRDYKSVNPELRGGLLKGYGSAQNIKIPQGKVISGSGEIRVDMLVSQAMFHPNERDADAAGDARSRPSIHRAPMGRP